MLDPAATNHFATSLLTWLARASLSAAGIATVILVVQTVFSRWLSPTWRYRLWAVLVLRLLLPVLPSSPASIANLKLEDRVSRWWTTLTERPTPAPPLSRVKSDDTFVDRTTPGITVTVVKEPLSFTPTANATIDLPPTPSQPGVLPRLLLVAWATVAAFLFFRLLVSNWRLSQRLTTAESANAAVLALLRECCAAIGVRTPPTLLITSAVKVPAAAGVFKPRILMPPGLLESLSPAEQRTILLHELAHIRRRDVAGNWVLALIQIVHWFNPVLWFAFARLRADRELARDATVLSLAQPQDLRHYANTLLKLTESLSTPTFPPLLAPTHHVAVGMYGGKNGLKRRLHMIARLPQSRRRFDWTGPVLSLALVAVLLTSARSQTADTSSSPPATQPTLPRERHEIKVPVLSEMPILGTLFTSGSDGSAKAPAETAYTPNQIARVDPQMQNRLNQLLEIKLKIETLGRTLHEKHPEMLSLQSELALRQKQVDDYASQFNREYAIEQRPDGTLVVSPKNPTALHAVEGRTAELTRQARALSDAGKYKEALDAVEEILKIDAANGYAVGVRPLLADKIQNAGQPVDRERRITSLMQRARDFNESNEYENALDTVHEILKLDPSNAYATAIRPRLVEQVEARRKALAQLDALLEKKLPALTFDAVGFSDVVDFLRDVSGANIFVNWKALEAAGIDRNTPVSANLRNIKFSKALNVILDSVGGGQVKLGFTADEGVISVSTKEDLTRNVVVRVYDIRDLLIDASGVVATTDTARPAPATQPASREDIVKQITKLIMDTINTDSWKDRGGSVGALRELQGQLIVTQTPENHRRLVALLEQLRQERSIQITVEARFVSCDHRIMDDLIAGWNRSDTPPAPVKTPPTTRPTGPWISGKNAEGIFLTDAQLTQFMHLIEKAPESIITTSPRVTLWNGQRAYVKVATSKSYLSGYTPTTKGDGEIRYEPVTKTADPGILMDLTATISADRRFVTVSLHPQVTTLLGFDRVSWPGSPKNVDLMVQEPRLKTSELNTILSIPDGGSALLSGLDDPNFGAEPSGAGANRPSSTRGIYLLVRPTIIRTEPKQMEFSPPLFK